MTPTDLARELQAITAALARRLVIVREIVEMDGTISATFRKTVRLHNERNTP